MAAGSRSVGLACPETRQLCCYIGPPEHHNIRSFIIIRYFFSFFHTPRTFSCAPPHPGLSSSLIPDFSVRKLKYDHHDHPVAQLQGLREHKPGLGHGAKAKAVSIYEFDGLGRKAVTESSAGSIIAMSGIGDCRMVSNRGFKSPGGSSGW